MNNNENMAQTPPYILIAGHGRSGTNWLLDILDASSITHCRNEPNEVLGSTLECVQSLWYSKQSLERVQELWVDRVAQAKISVSERDHHIATPKNHVYALSQKMGLASLPVRPKVKKVLGTFFPELRKGEWTMPWWISDQDSLRNSCAVLKMNMLAAWFINWHVLEYPRIPVLHIVRHPNGYLNSSINRFFSKCTPEELESEQNLYQTMLKTAISHAPEWISVLGDIPSMSLLEAVSWFWRVNNEMIYANCKNHGNYRLVIYEDIVRDPIGKSSEIYDFCGLPWTDDIQHLISDGLDQSVWGPLSGKPIEIAEAWRHQLAPESLNLMSRILMDSPMQGWWSTEIRNVL